jgi:iodotyrosine deiodinase
MAHKMINGYPYIAYHQDIYDESTMLERSATFYNWANQRRSCRDFSSQPFAKQIIENIIRTANTAPSGANKQPWTFCVVDQPEIKQQIRIAAEIEEKKSYEGRMSAEWLADLAHLGTTWEKPFLETAPYLIVVFKRSYELDAHHNKHQNYYVTESVGLACGMLLMAIQYAGLVALTHTPSPMNFLCKLLQRPENEKPFLLIPVGLPAQECWIPDIQRKSISDIMV